MGVNRFGKTLGGDTLSLRYFLNRSAVLSQYHEFLRVTKPLESSTKKDVRRQIREVFEMYRQNQDENQVSLLLRQAKDQLKHVSELVDSAVAHQSQNTSLNNSIHQKNSWTDDAEAHGNKDDVKGRIGVGWPWKNQRPVKKIQLEGIKRR
jgi:aminoglycoside phosphotransferase family enzyme